MAGTNTAGFFGDGGIATNAALNNPEGVAVDPYGNLYIADDGNNCIRMVDTNGFISTIAGTNSGGFLGDGGAATSAKFSRPSSVAVDGYGNLYIVDSGNNRIRRVNTNGIVATIAGTNGAGFSGDWGAATNARLYNPNGIVADAYGYLFIADSGNDRIRQVDPNGIISTVAGNGGTLYNGDEIVPTNAALNNPFGIVEVAGDLVVSDQNNNRIRKIALGRNPLLQINNSTITNAGNYQVIVTSLSGSVTSSIVSLSVVFPPSIVTEPQSTVITNGYSGAMAMIASGTGPLNYQWYFDNTAVSSATNAGLNFTDATAGLAGGYTCIVTNAYGAVTSGITRLLILTPPIITIQPTNQTVVAGSGIAFNVGATGTGPLSYQLQFNGTNLPNQNDTITRLAGTPGETSFGGDGGPATNAFLGSPSALAIDAAGDIFIADPGNNRIRMVNMNFASASNGLIGIIQTFAGTNVGGYSGDGGLATNAELKSPNSVALDGWGNLYIADTGNNRIRKVDTNGVITTVAGTNSFGFSGDGGLAVNAKLSSPEGIAVDAWGNILIADTSNNRIRKINTNGIITTVAGTNSIGGFSGDGGPAIYARLNIPEGLSADQFGNVFFSDYNSNRIRKIDSNGIISTVAGDGLGGFFGDGGAATNASLSGPSGVVADAYGDLYIADHGSSHIRMVNASGSISTVAGTGGTGYSNDGGIATNSNFGAPIGVALDSIGNLYVTGDNSLVCKVNFGLVPFLQLNNLGATNAGNYDVVVTSPYGSVTSSVVSLTVLSPPIITTQPQDTSAAIGDSASFSVTVSNYPPFGYQWYTSSGRTATAISFIMANGVHFIVVSDSGQGYSATPQVHVVGGGGSGAIAQAVLQNGFVFNIVSVNPGTGYTNPPAILIDPPSPVVNTVLPGQTNSGLSFFPVTSATATNYFVVITNNYGSVTSSVAGLFTFLPPQNFTVGAATNGLQLQLTGSPYWNYILQSATNLTPPVNWQSILTNQADQNGNWNVTITNLSTQPGSFYRTVGL